METEKWGNAKARFISPSYWFGQPESYDDAQSRIREGAIVIILYVVHYFFRSYVAGVFGLIPIDIIGLVVLAGALYFLKWNSAHLVSSIIFFLYAAGILVYVLYIALNNGIIGGSLLVSLILIYVAYRTLRAGIFLHSYSVQSSEKE